MVNLLKNINIAVFFIKNILFLIIRRKFTYSPLDGTLLSTVPMSSKKDLDAAVEAAKAAFPKWSKTPIKERVQVFFRYKYLLEKHLKELAELCSEENGKTYGESVAEIEKSIELTEFATSLPQLVTGEILEVSRGVECRTEHVALGVVASIVPFNFQAWFLTGQYPMQLHWVTA
jgi:malonate-semialdehyde dehydrogenase (acetylating)/methylmalonate-semialdehyde dehydrogenase